MALRRRKMILRANASSILVGMRAVTSDIVEHMGNVLLEELGDAIVDGPTLEGWAELGHPLSADDPAPGVVRSVLGESWRISNQSGDLKDSLGVLSPVDASRYTVKMVVGFDPDYQRSDGLPTDLLVKFLTEGTERMVARDFISRAKFAAGDRLTMELRDYGYRPRY